MFLCGVVRHAVISPYPSRRFIPPSAWRWVRPHDILGTRAAVPFVNKPLWFYASRPKTHITRNSEYLCVVLAICETKAQNGTAQSSIALVCNVTCSLSLSHLAANMAPSARLWSRLHVDVTNSISSILTRGPGSRTVLSTRTLTRCAPLCYVYICSWLIWRRLLYLRLFGVK